MSKVKIKPKQGHTGGRIDQACQTSFGNFCAHGVHLLNFVERWEPNLTRAELNRLPSKQSFSKLPHFKLFRIELKEKDLELFQLLLWATNTYN